MAVTFDSPDDVLRLVHGMQTPATDAPPKKDPDEGKTAPKPDPKPAPAEPETKTADTKSDSKPDPKPDSKATAAPADAPKPDAKAATKPDAKPAPTPDSKPDLKAAAAQAKSDLWSATKHATRHPVMGIPGLVKAEYGLGKALGAKAADGIKGGNIAAKIGKGGVKFAGRLLPGVGLIYGGVQAYRNFERGDYIGATIALVSMIPGPIGWVALGVSAIWELGDFGDKVDVDAPPDGIATFMLPGEVKDEAGVRSVDAALTEAQRKIMSFQDGPDGLVWTTALPKANRLDGPSVQSAVETWLNELSALFEQIDKTMQQSNENYFSQQRQKLAPHFAAMKGLRGQSSEVLAAFKAYSDAADEAHKAVHKATRDARSQLAEHGELRDQAPATAATSALEKAISAFTAADSKLGNLYADPPAPAWIGVTAQPGTREAPAPAPAPSPTPTPRPNPTPLPGTPSPTTPQPAKPETPKATDDALNKLLSQLGQQVPKVAPPTMPTSGLGGGSPLGSGSGLGGTPMGGTPLSQTRPETKTEEPKKVTDEKKPERKRDELKPLTNAKPEQQKAQTKPEPKPETKPAVAPVAAPAAAGAPAPAGQAKAAEKPNNDVDVKGQKATFPDPKTAKMAQLLAAADPTHPKSLADAAAEAGLKPPVPGQDPGKQLNPADAKPGDLLVAGEKKFMLLGDGKFYDLTDYKAVGSDELPKTMGDRAGYFRLDDANPGQPAPGTQPVSPQSQTGVAHQVPNPTGAPQGPVNGNPPAGPAMPPGGVPSVGAPGVPKPGAPGAGPGNAGATDTGTGQGGPSTAGGQRMDPAAVR